MGRRTTETLPGDGCSSISMPATGTRSRTVAIAFAAGCACLIALTLALGASDRAGAADAKATVVGQTNSSPRPNCPTPKGDNVPADKACQAMGRVTGFQTSADGRRNPFKVRKPGTIVAWSVDISKPNKKERTFFAEALSKSGPPSARLAILKPKGKGRFKLVKQSPVVQLDAVLGNRPVFTLTDPLRVRKGMIVALTTPTWISNLADAGASASDEWRASREQGQCLNEDDLLKRSRPQQKAGGKRSYDCTYEGARLLYWAFLAS
jgi:hypothetical protein